MPKRQILINYAPGDECRVAVTEDGRLEDLHSERANAVSHVGNIYVGKVVNVESGIQAAFIDFGLEHNGFLHISDLHPQYFPGEDEETTESVGKKIPRRERPPIQRALKRGQEIVVQVIKEGVGTKGPTVTSYLSIPGRFLVMMPGMDRVGVSRKIEDDEQRRAMRDILDQLDLPDGFGFILRTAGMNQTKTELKRDLAYLNRLWRDMEQRRKKGKGPRLLYAESDLLLRSLRDILTPDISEIVIDHESALRRASRFLKIFAPRSAPELLHYNQPAPIFHAFGIEDQIQAMHARRVPLPSGGSLVIDEAEALVAIDVNSGKTRGSGDAESTAFKTNKEAVDEICRQLKLRDLGGIVILDLIDMRSRTNRRDIETRLRDNLKKDAARSKALPISQFGMIELTRQRMRGSHRNVHFAPCPDCEGRGFVQRPDSVASDAVRSLGALLAHERVRSVELVVSPRVAGELLSSRRRSLNRLETTTGKSVRVRVSETIPVDRVTMYAYDDRGADVEIDRLPRLAETPTAVVWDNAVGADSIVDSFEDEQREMDRAEAEPDAEEEIIDEPAPILDLAEGIGSGDEAGGSKKKRRRRRRRGKKQPDADNAALTTDSAADNASIVSDHDDEDEDDAPTGGSDAHADSGAPAESEANGKKKRRRRRRRRGRKQDGEFKSAESSDIAAHDDDATADPERLDTRRKPKSDSVAEPTPATLNGQAGTPAPASRLGSRGDSWDLDPAEVAPPPKRRASDKPSTDLIDDARPMPGMSAPKQPAKAKPEKPAPVRAAESAPTEAKPSPAPKPARARKAKAGMVADDPNISEPASKKPAAAKKSTRKKAPAPAKKPSAPRKSRSKKTASKPAVEPAAATE